ncbi:CapA family protein [Marinisporobacter balticus]|uniref:Poly-gamma-glutamate synthesis protein (Capsule biosynthesis protein) n=1 Tax=Marinisporobacter balticus TaxID=2018667 RepID=A0A4R2KZI1_9FIRM|nr:CapA family protein [Marinisporobacter balticus]TCO79343.1 poly-gamma-glutamate synthesis protein (capsule biosynthesis protein) [Marinisporobacter balticus]
MRKKILLLIWIVVMMSIGSRYAFLEEDKDINIGKEEINKDLDKEIDIDKEAAIDKGIDQNTVISLMGDVLLDRSIGKLIEINGVEHPWEHVSPILTKSDFAFINLETSIGVGGKPIAGKTYTFQSKPETLKGVINAGIRGVGIANNHILDYGQEGFIETLKNLEKMEIPYSGGGRNIKDAQKPVIWEKEDMKIGFLAFSRVIPDINWYVTDKRAGVLSAYDYYTDNVLKLIEETKKDVDFLIVSVHWGKELEDYPEEKDIKFAKKLVDGGADCIMGHHPHVLQGVEFYKNKPIIYSLGNFVFNARGKRSNQTMIFHIEMNKRGIVKTRVTPIFIRNGQPTPAQGKEKEEIINILNTLSKEWNTKFLMNGEVKNNI